MVRQLAMASRPKTFKIKLRIVIGEDVILGPGKADLLQFIDETGSIAAAGRRMGMSYKRAWYLVETINGYFEHPLVETVKGGRAGGGARLTPLGARFLADFRDMESRTAAAVTPTMKRIVRKVKTV
jgi:molybdate transport system regulatory protein